MWRRRPALGRLEATAALGRAGNGGRSPIRRHWLAQSQVSQLRALDGEMNAMQTNVQRYLLEFITRGKFAWYCGVHVTSFCCLHPYCQPRQPPSAAVARRAASGRVARQPIWLQLRARRRVSCPSRVAVPHSATCSSSTPPLASPVATPTPRRHPSPCWQATPVRVWPSSPYFLFSVVSLGAPRLVWTFHHHGRQPPGQGGARAARGRPPGAGGQTQDDAGVARAGAQGGQHQAGGEAPEAGAQVRGGGWGGGLSVRAGVLGGSCAKARARGAFGGPPLSRFLPTFPFAAPSLAAPPGSAVLGHLGGVWT